jgi:hypothetical protein
MGPDGISYLDMGDAYLRGDWHTAVNVYWSPLYSWLLGAALKILRPSAYWEFPVVHVVNSFIFLGALASFEFLLRALIDWQRKRKPSGEDGLVSLPPWAWYLIGYSVFLWISFELMKLEQVTPDMCVAAFVYLASGLLLRIRGGCTAWFTFALLGIVLGFGYLAKAILFPLSFIFFGVALFSVGHLRKAAPRVLLAVVIFLAIGGPFIAALSIAMSRPTFGESGRLNYIWYVDRPDWIRLPANAFRHPISRIHEAPVVYEFARPIRGTYPLWENPAYWNEGLKAHFDLKAQATALKITGLEYYNILYLSEAGLLAGLIVLFCLTPSPLSSLSAVCENWHLLIPAVAALGAYSLIHFEGRLIGPFILLLWLGIFSGVRLPQRGESGKLAMGAVLAIVITMGGQVAASTLLDVVQQRQKAPVDWEVAQALNRLGIQPGDKVASIRHPYWEFYYWARLARIQVIAEMPPEEVDRFWSSSPQVQEEVTRAFANTEAKAIITRAPPSCASTTAWTKLGDTDYYAYLLH